MRRSKLEMYVDILNVLAQRGPLKVSHIMYKANVNCNILKEYLDFLIKQGLIEERVVRKSSVVYANTARGTEVIKFFRELDKALSVKEEDGKILPVPYSSNRLSASVTRYR
jgi:predicted transcriptional regulator